MRWGILIPFSLVWRFGLLVFIGALPFLAIWFVVYLAIWVLAMLIACILIFYGVTYKRFTGRDARVKITRSNSELGLEDWMERKGWVRFG